MIKAGIVGGTGYTGVELLRLLAQHPQVELKAITSRKEAGTPVARMFPSLRRRVDITFTEPTPRALAGCDIVFFATTSFKPAKTETGITVQVPPFINTGEKIKIDTTEGTYMERA